VCPKWLQRIPNALTKFDSFEDGGVKKEEGFPVVRAFVSGHGFAQSTGFYIDISIALLPKPTKHVSGLVLLMFNHILTRGESRGLNKEVLGGRGVEGPVFYLGRRVRSCFGSSHLKGSQREKKRRKKRRFNGRWRKNPGKPEKPKTRTQRKREKREVHKP